MRDARMDDAIRDLAERINDGELTEDEADREAEMLAGAYGIGECEIWDMLAEYSE